MLNTKHCQHLICKYYNKYLNDSIKLNSYWHLLFYFSQFLREELKYEKGAEKRQKAFHQNDDMYISVKDLWDAWVKSEVRDLIFICYDTY